MSKLKQHNYFLFELWVTLRAFPFGLTTLAVTMLVQDKLCLQKYNQSVAYCQSLSTTSDSLTGESTRDSILSDSAKFSEYQNLLQCVPMVIWSLFSGSFLDKFNGGTKLLLTLGILGDFVSISLQLANIYFFSWDSYLVLLPSLTYWLTGGMANFFTVSYRYVVITTTKAIRPIKFMLFAFALFLGLSLGQLIAGHVLMTRSPTTEFPQIRTYHYNFLLTLAFEIVCLGFVFKLENANKQKEEEEEEEERNPAMFNCETDEEASVSAETSSILDLNHNPRNYQTLNDEITQIEPENEETLQRKPNFFVILFDISNVRETIVTLLKARAGRIRMAIFTLIFILLAYILLYFGLQSVMYQFCEKVYQWGPAQYSNNNFIVNVIQTAFMTFAVTFLVRKLKFTDESLLMISIVSYFGQQICMGTVLKEYAYFVGQFVGSFSGFAPIAVRNKISKLIPSTEVGKVFSILSTMEATMPFFGSLVYSNIFAATLASYTGATFLMSGAIMLVTLVACIFNELYCRTKHLSIENAWQTDHHQQHF